jgi:hypothetical protein
MGSSSQRTVLAILTRAPRLNHICHDYSPLSASVSAHTLQLNNSHARTATERARLVVTSSNPAVSTASAQHFNTR